MLAEEARLDTVTVCRGSGAFLSSMCRLRNAHSLRTEFCNIFREQGTSHCYDCNACVMELDHHW